VEFDEAAEPPGTMLLARLLRKRVAELDGAYAVFCGGEGSGRATLQAGTGPEVPLEDARETCAGVRSRLGRD
jgi:hypothetical protein